MRADVRITSLALLIVLVSACAFGLSSMIDYSTLRTERRAQFFAYGDMLVIQVANPQGQNLVLEVEPLDHGRVILVAGVTSSGAAGVKTYCRDLGPLSPAPDWATRVFWRNRT